MERMSVLFPNHAPASPDTDQMLQSSELNSTSPTGNISANIHVEHTQLRDLISCPSGRGDILFASTSGLSARNLHLENEPERNVPNVSFAPTCVATGSGLVAAGGVHAELFLAPLSAIPSYSNASRNSAPVDENWTSTIRLHGSINNALFFTNLALASSPYHLPTSYDSIGNMPRLFVSNNDCTMRVYNVATHSSSFSHEPPPDAHSKMRKKQHKLTKAGVLQAKTCVNHASVSPDGRTLLAVGDTTSVYLYSISGGDSVSFYPSTTHTDAFSDAAFGTAWSSDGLSYAVASQDGCVKVWDVRSSKPLTTLRGAESAKRYVPHTANLPRRTRAIPAGLDAPLADGSQFMSLSPPPSLFGVPTSASSHYYGFLDGGGHFGTPGSISGATVVPSNASIPDKEMDLVIPGIRSLKFVKSGGRELLAFTEHLSHVHLVDAQSFNEHVILRVPSPPLSRQSSYQNRAAATAHSHSVPSLQIPPSARQTAASTSLDPWPASAWCSPTNSPTSSPRSQWPSGTILPSNHEEERDVQRVHQSQPQIQPPPSLYTDLRSSLPSNLTGRYDVPPTWVHPTNYRPVPPPSAVGHDLRMPSWVSPQGFITSGLSGAMYEFMPPPSSVYRQSLFINPHVRNVGQQHVEEGDEEEDKPATRPSSPQDARDPRLQHPLMALNSSNPPPSSSANSVPPRERAQTNIRIVHHPATRTRSTYDDKHNCTHLSGMCFDPSGRWMYVSTERSIAEWDLAEVLGNGNKRLGATWGKTIFEGGEWA